MQRGSYVLHDLDHARLGADEGGSGSIGRRGCQDLQVPQIARPSNSRGSDCHVTSHHGNLAPISRGLLALGLGLEERATSSFHSGTTQLVCLRTRHT